LAKLGFCGIYRFLIYDSVQNNVYIKSYDVICTQVIQTNSSTQIQVENLKQNLAPNSSMCKGGSSHVYEAETGAAQPISTRNLCPAQIEIGEEETSKNTRMNNQVFEELLLEAVDEGLSLLGVSAKQALYLHLERAFKIGREEIPGEIEEFTEAIEEIFGDGAKLLEIQIMKRLFEKIGHFKYFAGQEDIVFAEYVEALRQAFCGIS